MARLLGAETLEQRFWAKVDTSAGMLGCWLWLGARSPKGYGVMGRGGRGSGNVFAHRVALELDGRPVGPGQDAMHSCDNPPCVNPAHLRPGTRHENILESVARGRWGNRARYGERHHNAKVTWPDVEAIRTSAEPASVLARRLGIGPGHVRAIRRGDVWKAA